jgi:hypothetical protein
MMEFPERIMIFSGIILQEITDIKITIPTKKLSNFKTTHYFNFNAKLIHDSSPDNRTKSLHRGS